MTDEKYKCFPILEKAGGDEKHQVSKHEADISQLEHEVKIIRQQIEIFKKTHDRSQITVEDDFFIMANVYVSEFLENPAEKDIYIECMFESKSTYEFRHNIESWLLYALKKYGEKIYILESLINLYAYRLTHKERQQALPFYEMFKKKYGPSRHVESLLKSGW